MHPADKARTVTQFATMHHELSGCGHSALASIGNLNEYRERSLPDTMTPSIEAYIRAHTLDDIKPHPVLAKMERFLSKPHPSPCQRSHRSPTLSFVIPSEADLSACRGGNLQFATFPGDVLDHSPTKRGKRATPFDLEPPKKSAVDSKAVHRLT